MQPRPRERMHVVPDVNVIISSAITPSGNPGRIYTAWKRRDLIAAVEGGADCIISGDRHLKTLGSYQGIPILTPEAFVTQYKIP